MTEPTRNELPPFPVDEQTLDMLWDAIHPWEQDPDATRSSVGDFLRLMDMKGGSDPDAVEWSDDDPILPLKMMRDQSYHEHDVIDALITEIRRLRSLLPTVHEGGTA